MAHQMKADTQYGDLKGTASADISDFIGKDNDLQDLCEIFNLDRNRYKIIGISISGTMDFSGALICIDREKSKNQREHIVKIYLNKLDEPIFDLLFKRFEVILFDRFEQEYQERDYDETIILNEKNNDEDEN